MPTQAKVGDRVRLVAMPGDPAALESGLTSTVVHVSMHGTGRDRWLQLNVDWDTGRSLHLVTPPDIFEIIVSDK